MKSSDGIFVNTGSADSLLFLEKEDQSSGIVVIYSNGQLCGSDMKKMKTAVNLQCYIGGDALMSGDMKGRIVDPLLSLTYISSVDNSDECTLVMYVNSPLGCPINRPADPQCAGRNESDCLSVPYCYCGFCDGQCVAYYEECQSDRVFECVPPIDSNSMTTIDSTSRFLYGICVVALIASIISCIWAGILKRRRIRSRKMAMEMMAHPIESMNGRIEHEQHLPPLMYLPQQFYYYVVVPSESHPPQLE